MRRKILSSLAVLAIALLAVVPYARVGATAFLAGYTYQKSMTAVGVASTLTNYPRMIHVHKGTGTDNVTDMFLSNNAASWTSTVPNDLRFTQGDGTTQLPYWVEGNTSNTTDAYVWVNLNSIAASNNTTFYAYTGKASDATSSNGTTTFTFFDDFSGTLSTNWNTTGSTSVTGGILDLDGSSNTYVYSKTSWGDNTSVRALVKSVNANTGSHNEDMRYEIYATGYGYRAYWDYAGGTYPNTTFNYNGTIYYSTMLGWTASVYHTQEIMRDSTTSVKYQVDNANTVTMTSGLSTSNKAIIFQANDNSPHTSHVYVDWALIRSYVGTEPTWGTWGSWTQQTPSLANTPTIKAFGIIVGGNTYYAVGFAPSNPVSDNECTFHITNDGAIAIDISVSETNPTGGVGATLVTGAPGSNQLRDTIYYSGQNPASGVTANTTAQSWKSNLAASATLYWDFKREFGTTTDGVAKTSTITFVATAH